DSNVAFVKRNFLLLDDFVEHLGGHHADRHALGAHVLGAGSLSVFRTAHNQQQLVTGAGNVEGIGALVEIRVGKRDEHILPHLCDHLAVHVAHHIGGGSVVLGVVAQAHLANRHQQRGGSSLAGNIRDCETTAIYVQFDHI